MWYVLFFMIFVLIHDCGICLWRGARILSTIVVSAGTIGLIIFSIFSFIYEKSFVVYFVFGIISYILSYLSLVLMIYGSKALQHKKMTRPTMSTMAVFVVWFVPFVIIIMKIAGEL